MSLKPVNLALRFLLELAALLALSYGGFRIGHGVFQDLMLGVGMPMLAALVWGRFIAPESPLRVADPLRVALELGIFALAVAVLVFVGQSHLGCRARAGRGHQYRPDVSVEAEIADQTHERGN